ncbi:Protein of unknown function [Massilia sp. CF038]|nr:Protein of unknown function [Massilia sp. CF038]
MAVGLLVAIFGLIASYALAAQLWGLWGTLTYLPAQAQVQQVEHYTVPGRRGAVYRSTIHYHYEADGRRIEASADIAGRAIQTGTTIPVWFDPNTPRQNVLTRQFDWLLLLLFALATGFPTLAVAAAIGRSDDLTVPARGRLLRADPDNSRVLAVFAVIMNLWTWPMACLATVLLALGEGSAWTLVVFGLLAIAMTLARTGWRKLRTRQRLGTPLLEIIPSAPGQFKGRLHFQPPLGMRCEPQVEQIFVQIQVGQVQMAPRNGHAAARLIWAHRIEATLARGCAHADFSLAVPEWPRPQRGVKPACWKISVMALEATAHFRLAPELIRGDPASTT